MTADAVGGIWTYALDLGRALVGRGASVTLAILGPRLSESQRGAAAGAGVNVVELGHHPEWLADGAEEVERAGAALEALVQRQDADLLQLNHPALGRFVRCDRPVLAVCHSCVGTWWAAVEGTALPPMLAWQAELVGCGYEAATLLIAPSHAFAAATRDTYGLPQLPRVIYNGRENPAARAVRTPGRMAMTVGRLWDAGKGLATLDAAAALTNVPVRAVGPTRGPNGSTITLSKVEALGVMGEQEVRDRLADRPIVVSAARYEPFGLSVLEAAQAACALVLSDIPTFRELWGDAALFVPPGEAPGFAAAIDRLVGDPSLRASLGSAAQSRATRYTLDTQVEAMMQVYTELLAGADAGSRAA